MDTLAYLEMKSELELRGFAFKLGVRMTGPRADLEARLAAAARDLGRDRFRQVCVHLRLTGMLLYTGFPFDSYMKLYAVLPQYPHKCGLTCKCGYLARYTRIIPAFLAISYK